jgi:hypothetical protein
MLDEKLNGYINNHKQIPPVINERRIVETVAGRRQRTAIVLLSLASLLWTLVLYGFSFLIGRDNQAAGIALFFIISIGHMGSALFVGIILKSRKVVVK